MNPLKAEDAAVMQSREMGNGFHFQPENQPVGLIKRRHKL